MGSSQSTHKFTIVNDGNDNIIKISKNVAKRLSQAASQNMDEEKIISSEDVITRYRPMSKDKLPEDVDIYYPYYTVSATEVHNEKEKHLVNQEIYWQNRLNNLKKNHEIIDQKLENEYNQSKHIFDDYKGKQIFC
jgi:hypothetical protein